MSTTSRGLFITFEGPDGSGKSTQARLLAERLRGAGYDVLESVEPGGTPIGQQIRRILLDPANQELSATAELLLMFAARAQNVEQWILPALEQGKIVISDRFTDSSIAYQGAGRGLGWETVLTIDRIAYSPSPPIVFAVVDFDHGGRLPIELTDVEADDLTIGDRVEMTFRKLFTADGIHNYFWKARPIRAQRG